MDGEDLNVSAFWILLVALCSFGAFGVVMMFCAIFANNDNGLFLFLGTVSLAVCWPLFRAIASYS